MSLVPALALLLGSPPVAYVLTEKAEEKMLESSPNLVRREAGDGLTLDPLTVDDTVVRMTELSCYWYAMTDHAREYFKLYKSLLTAK